ncbi:DUF1771-domain-containing protein [Violaceomyces palustris]|uniref:DUF1771-domain-containing protein n=1 Tax=Violaceomyces palustris TaxID=1673888 RepID=A0ACD0P3H1_9BASI|nr:DUF1771-domain-containing protein [Violaceomyces palustris]
MDDLIRFIKQHKGQFIKFGKKAFTWWKKQQSGGQQGQQQQQQYHQQQQQQQYGGGGGYAGAVSQGNNYHQQQQSSNQYGGQSWDQPPAQGEYSSPHKPSLGQGGAQTTGPHYKYSQDNQVNQHDANYVSLRSRAHEEGDKMAKCFDESHRAYNQGDGARAKQLSNEGHQHKQEMERLNKQAADWIFMANNEDSPQGTVDLHGLYTNEAISRTEAAVREGQSKGWPELRIIVGKGLHSKDHVQHIAPAVEKLMRDYRLDAHLDPRNAGVLVVNLQASSAGSANFTRDLAKQVSGNEQECTIM